jgi:hypothetical protein
MKNLSDIIKSAHSFHHQHLKNVDDSPLLLDVTVEFISVSIKPTWRNSLSLLPTLKYVIIRNMRVAILYTERDIVKTFYCQHLLNHDATH